MSNDKWAVGVGYNFGLIPSIELEDIKLGKYGTIHFDGKNYTLFKAMTYEGSRKIDLLLDKYGEHPIKEYRMEPVIMSGEFEMILPGFNKDEVCMGFGSYTFLCEDKEVPVDFSGTSWNMEQEGDKISVSFETGGTWLNTDCFLDDCYEENYKKAGLRLNDITAEFLSKATKIIEFHIDGEINNKEFETEYLPAGGKFTLKSLCFSDGINNYPVNEEIIEAFNKSLIPEITFVNEPNDDYFDKYAYICHITDHPVVFSAELPDNMDKEIDKEFVKVFRNMMNVKCCDYGCDTYPNGITKNINGSGQYTFQQKVWDFINQMEKTFDCKCNFIEGYNGFTFDFEFGCGENKGCYSFGAGNNGQEFSQVLYLKDYKQIREPETLKALTYIDSNIYRLLEDCNLRVRPREVNKSLDSKISEAKEKQAPVQENTGKGIEPVI